MSLSDRRSLLVSLAALPLAACGFAPVYGPEGAAGRLQNRLRADDPADKDAFDLVARLESRLGRPDAGAIRLGYQIDVSEENTSATPDRFASRVRVVGQVRYSVVQGDAVLTEGKVDAFTAYSTTSTPLATRAAAEDARRRLMVILADGIVTRLQASARQWLPPA
jgi:LPS-assembly lipoprotein